jgi:hypothetical protein
MQMPSKEQPAVGNLFPEEKSATGNLFPEEEEEPAVGDLFPETISIFSRETQGRLDAVPLEQTVPLIMQGNDESLAALFGKEALGSLLTNVIKGAQLIDTPRRIASNIQDLEMKHGIPLLFRAGETVFGTGKGIPHDELVQAFIDGWHGEEYSDAATKIKRMVLPAPLYDKVEKWIDNHERFPGTHIRVKPFVTAGKFTINMGADILWDAFFWGGIGQVALKAPGIKGIFNDVPDNVLHKGFQEAVKWKAKKYNMFDNVINNLSDAGRYVGKNGERAGKVWGDDAAEIAEVWGKEYGFKPIQGVWPHEPSIKENMELAERYGMTVLPIAPQNPQALASFTRLDNTIRIRPDIAEKLKALDPNWTSTTEGGVFLHELGHGIWHNLPEESKDSFAVYIREARSKVFKKQTPLIPTMEDLAERSEKTLELFPTLYGSSSTVEAFAEVFSFINQGRAGDVHHKLAAAYIDAMKNAGIPYIDINDVKKTLMAREFIDQVTKPTLKKVTDGEDIAIKPFVSSAKLNKQIEAINHGKLAKLDELSPHQIQAIAADITTAANAPKNFSAWVSAGSIGGIPSWRMYEIMGIPEAYKLIDDAMTVSTIAYAKRSDWVFNMKKQFKKEFGETWTDDSIYDDIASRFADEGPEAVLEGAKDVSSEIRSYISSVVEADRELHWNAMADLLEEAGLIGKGLDIDDLPARHEFYFHRRNFRHDIIKRVEAGKGVLPSDYRIQRAMAKKLPKGVSAPEVIARSADENVFRRDWTNITSMAYRESLRKLYFEPAASRMDGILDLLDGAIKDEAKEYSTNWVRHVRGMPSAWDSKLNRLNKKVFGPAYSHVFGKEMSERSFERFAGEMRKLAYGGTISFNTRSLIKQGFQSQLTIATIGNKATLAGWESMFTPGGKQLLKHFPVTVGGNRLAMSSFDISTKEGLNRLTTTYANAIKFGAKPFSAVDMYMNVAGAGNGALFYIANNSQANLNRVVEYAAKKSVQKKLTPQNFWDTLASMADDGLIDDWIDMANRNIKVTQFSYNPWDMPAHLWSSVGKNTLQFTNWPSHFFGAFIPQMYRQAVKGVNVFGLRATAAQRIAPFSYITKMAAIAAVARGMGYNMDYLAITGPLPTGRVGGFFELPVPVTPSTEMAIVLGNIAVGALESVGEQDSRRLKDGLKSLPKAMQPYILAGNTLSRINSVRAGKAPVDFIFLPKTREKETEPSILEGLPGLKTGLKPLR